MCVESETNEKTSLQITDETKTVRSYMEDCSVKPTYQLMEDNHKRQRSDSRAENEEYDTDLLNIKVV